MFLSDDQFSLCAMFSEVVLLVMDIVLWAVGAQRAHFLLFPYILIYLQGLF